MLASIKRFFFQKTQSDFDANEAFRRNQCGFLQMAEVIEQTMQRATYDASPTLDTYFSTDAEARAIACELLQ